MSGGTVFTAGFQGGKFLSAVKQPCHKAGTINVSFPRALAGTWFRGIFTFNQSKSLTVERAGENEPKEDYFLNEKRGGGQKTSKNNNKKIYLWVAHEM